jgi:hypothetical protein
MKINTRIGFLFWAVCIGTITLLSTGFEMTSATEAHNEPRILEQVTYA